MIDYFKKLSFQTMIYGMGDMVVKALAFLLIPLYARMLTAEVIGIYGLIQSFQLIMVLVLGLGFNTALFKVISDTENPVEKKEVVGTSIIFLMCWSLPLVGLMVAGAPLLSRAIWQTPENSLFLRYAFIAYFFDLFRVLLLAVLRTEEKSVHYSAINIVNFVLLAGLNIINVAVRKRGLLGIMESQLLATVIVAAVTWFYFSRRFIFTISKSRLRALLRFGLPLVPSGVAAWAIIQTSKYFIHHYLNDHEVGIYFMGEKFGTIVAMIMARPFRVAWLPFMFSIQNDSEAKRVYALTLTYFLAAGIFLVLFLSVLSREIIILAATEKFLESRHIIPLIALAYLCYGIFNTVDVGVLLSGKTVYYARITVITAVISLALNSRIIPKFGTPGAAFVTFFSYFLMALLMFITAQRLYPVQYETKRILCLFMTGVLIYLTSLLVKSDVLWMAVLVKSGLLAAYPVLLIVFRFFTPQEIAQLKNIGNLIKKRIGREKHG